MELDINFMRSVLMLSDELMHNGIAVVYIGKFTHQITKLFTAMYEDEMAKNSVERNVKKRVYHSMVEVLQNMQKHSSEFVSEYSLVNGLFMIGHQDETYYIITANKVSKHDMMHLTQAIETVNAATREELKQMYKNQLRNGTISQKGGAGLGLIDLARKTGEKLDYLFLPIDKINDYFVLKVEINCNNIDPED